MQFYNEVLTKLYEAVFSFLAPLQFKNYVLEQRITRWKIKEDCRLLENLFNKESKDGNAINVQRFMSELVHFKTGDKARALSAQGIIEKFLSREAEINQRVTEKRALLFTKVNDVKVWKANELNFYDQRLGQLKSLRMRLEMCQTQLITNINMLSRRLSESADLREDSKRKRKRYQEHSRKAVVRKQKRLLSIVCETTRLLTDGKREYESLHNDAVKIKRQDLCQEHSKLIPRYHLDALNFLIENEHFEHDALQSAKEMLSDLKEQKEKTKQQNKERKAKKPRKLYNTIEQMFKNCPKASKSSSSEPEDD